MYQASLPQILRMLDNLSAIVDKAVAHCDTRKIDPQVLFNARLYPDMLPFYRQVQIASDQAKGVAARLAGVEVPSFPDAEANFGELKARIAKTAEFLRGFSAEQIDGSESREIRFTGGQREFRFSGQQYLMTFVLPNFYFHVTTAYDILRHCGVELGKMDFLGAA
jgi:hypothetical protein